MKSIAPEVFTNRCRCFFNWNYAPVFSFQCDDWFNIFLLSSLAEFKKDAFWILGMSHISNQDVQWFVVTLQAIPPVPVPHCSLHKSVCLLAVASVPSAFATARGGEHCATGQRSQDEHSPRVHTTVTALELTLGLAFDLINVKKSPNEKRQTLPPNTTPTSLSLSGIKRENATSLYVEIQSTWHFLCI